MSDQSEKGSFVRILGRADTLTLAFGAMIGWGWVLLSGTWVLSAGSFGTLIAFLVGGGAITLIGLTYAELSSAMPKVGGEHVYTERALGRNWSFLCTWSLLFAYVTLCMFEAVALPTAIEYIAPSIHLGTLWQVLGADVDIGFVLIGVVATLVITAVNIAGIRVAALFQKITIVLIAIAGALLITGAFTFGSLENAKPFISVPWTGILSVVIMVPTMLMGFDVIPQSAEEIDLPPKDIGKLLVFSLMMAVGWYVIISLGVAMALPHSELQAASIASSDAATAVWGSPMAGGVLILGGVAGILTSWNAFVVGASRVLYALAKSRQIPAAFMALHPRFNTPYVAIYAIGLLSALAPLAGRQMLVWIVNAGSFSFVVAFLMVGISFVVLRRKEPDMERPFKVKYPRLVGYSAIVLSTALFGLYLPFSPAALVWPQEWGMLLIWAVIGLAFFVRYRNE